MCISGPDELKSAFAAMAKAGAQAVIVQDYFNPHREILLDLAAKHKLAYMSGTRETTLAGGLVSVSSSWLALYERAASYMDRILKGEKRGIRVNTEGTLRTPLMLAFRFGASRSAPRDSYPASLRILGLALLININISRTASHTSSGKTPSQVMSSD